MQVNMSGSNGRINVNGMDIEVRGGRIIVNGVPYGPLDGSPAPVEPAVKVIELDRDGRIVGDIHGDVEIRNRSGAPVTLIIEGAVDGSVTCDGNLTCESVGGSATASGDIKTEKVGGSANAGRDIQAGKIGGSANAGGGIRRG